MVTADKPSIVRGPVEGGEFTTPLSGSASEWLFILPKGVKLEAADTIEKLFGVPNRKGCGETVYWRTDKPIRLVLEGNELLFKGEGE